MRFFFLRFRKFWISKIWISFDFEFFFSILTIFVFDEKFSILMKILTNIVVGLSRKEFESVRRWVRVLEENRVFLFLFWFVTIDQPLSLWCITISRKKIVNFRIKKWQKIIWKMVKNDQIKSKMSFFEQKWSWKWPNKYGQVWLGLARSKSFFFRANPKYCPNWQTKVKIVNFRIKIMTKQKTTKVFWPKMTMIWSKWFWVENDRIKQVYRLKDHLLRGFQNFVKNRPIFDNFTILEPLTTEPIWPKNETRIQFKNIALRTRVYANDKIDLMIFNFWYFRNDVYSCIFMYISNAHIFKCQNAKESTLNLISLF